MPPPKHFDPGQNITPVFSCSFSQKISSSTGFPILANFTIAVVPATGLTHEHDHLCSSINASSRAKFVLANLMFRANNAWIHLSLNASAATPTSSLETEIVV